jgi:hypothetical protein
MNTNTLIAGSILTLILGACAGSQTEAEVPEQSHAKTPAPEPEQKGMKEGMSCPFSSPDVEVSVADMEGGVSLTFTGPDDRVESLRSHGARMAAMRSGKMMHGKGHMGKGMHKEHMGKGMQKEHMGKGMHKEHMGKGTHGEGGLQGQGAMGDASSETKPGGMMMKMLPTEAVAEDVPGGVKITLKAKNSEDVEKLRQNTKKRVEMMRSGQCPMMKMKSTDEAAKLELPSDDGEADHKAHHPKE